MGSLNEPSDIFAPRPPPTEREKRETRIALWAVAAVFPFFTAWLFAPKLLQEEWWTPAQERADQLGYYSAKLNVQEIPCRGWLSFDFGYTVDYRPQKGETLRRGRLCRRFGDDNWTWHPQ